MLCAAPLQNNLSSGAFRVARALLVGAGALGACGLGLGVMTYVMASPTFGWTGRSLSLLDPTYASKYIPIIASVSEHQPPTTYSYITGAAHHVGGQRRGATRQRGGSSSRSDALRRVPPCER